jgi:hypothetical protein
MGHNATYTGEASYVEEILLMGYSSLYTDEVSLCWRSLTGHNATYTGEASYVEEILLMGYSSLYTHEVSFC